MTPNGPEWWRDYSGAEYCFRGRRLDTGIDCWGLVVLVLRDVFGVVVDDFGQLYPHDGAAGGRQARAAITAELPAWREVPWEEGAVVLFREGGIPSHVGIALPKRGFVLHAHEDHDVTTFDAFSTLKWKGRFVGCFLPR
jgi:cell wall-associated NlpC family hydrolase